MHVRAPDHIFFVLDGKNKNQMILWRDKMLIVTEVAHFCILLTYHYIYAIIFVLGITT